MRCFLCDSEVEGSYCVCGQKMEKPEFKNTTIELKNYEVNDTGDPAYLVHIEQERLMQHKDWVNNSISETVNLSKKEKSSFWRKNLKLALNGELEWRV